MATEREDGLNIEAGIEQCLHQAARSRNFSGIRLYGQVTPAPDVRLEHPVLRAACAIAVALAVGCGGNGVRPGPLSGPADGDADGVHAEDACPALAEDEDGFEDHDGCPDLDDDADQIADADDLCRCVGEDRDGWEDDDGCPEEDNDRDRNHDACDRCPNEAEVYNGQDDEDGCPDRGFIRIEGMRIQIIEHVFFEHGSSVVQPVSFPLLQAVADTIQANPHIGRVRIVGHADRSERRAQWLGEKRAIAVRDWLVAHGVDPARLEIASMGATRPLVPPRPIALRARNRRVEFELVDPTGGAPPPPPPTPPPTAPPASGYLRTADCPEGAPPPPTDVCSGEAAVLDTDGDRIPDRDDRCVTEPETFNAIDDEDGCPDRCALPVDDPADAATGSGGSAGSGARGD
jgi:outer membrane protein OmpA-like peptidoglycan-associated protein